MIRQIFRSIKNLFALYYYSRTNERKSSYFRKKGATIGQGNRYNCDLTFMASEAYLVEIGDNNLFAGGVRLITHDGGVKVLNNLSYFEQNMDKMGRIKIGNNCFFGLDALVLPNVVVGDNVIVAARSVVTKSIPSNSVAAGIPAKVICSIDDYYKKNFDVGCFYPTPLLKDKESFLRNNVKKI